MNSFERERERKKNQDTSFKENLPQRFCGVKREPKMLCMLSRTSQLFTFKRKRKIKKRKNCWWCNQIMRQSKNCCIFCFKTLKVLRTLYTLCTSNKYDLNISPRRVICSIHKRMVMISNCYLCLKWITKYVFLFNK